MTAISVSVPSVRLWRARARRARRSHPGGRTRGELLTDLYMLLWFVVVYGGVAASIVRRQLEGSASAPLPAEPYWIGAAALLGVVGLAWRGLRALGPLTATQAERSWVLATPLDRSGVLLPRLAALVATGLAVGCAAAAAVDFFAARGAAMLPAAVAGGLWGAALLAGAVAAQAAPSRSRWTSLPGMVTIGAGALTAVVAVAAHFGGLPLTRPDQPVASVLMAVGLLAAPGAALAGRQALPRLDTVALGAGAQVAAATLTAAIWLDPSVLSGVVEVRRWRRVGSVPGRPFRGWGGRIGVLLQAEGRRVLRRPGALGLWVALALAQYAVAVVAPSAAGVSHVIGAYLAANRLSWGLRSVSRSVALRRTLGGTETQLRLVHTAVPALGAALWWLFTLPAGGGSTGALDALLVACIVGGSYRSSTRPPMSYGASSFDTPFGLFPVGLLLDLLRGPDLLGAAILLQMLLGG